MRLKNDVNLVDFLNQVQKCKYDVYMETVEEDKLNLKSVLSQYLFVVLVEQKDVWDHSRITCEEADLPICFFAGDPAKKQIGRSWAIIWKCREGSGKMKKISEGKTISRAEKTERLEAFGVVFSFMFEKQRNKDNGKRIKG